MDNQNEEIVLIPKYIVYELRGAKGRTKHKLAQFDDHDSAIEYMMEQMSGMAHGLTLKIETINVKIDLKK